MLSGQHGGGALLSLLNTAVGEEWGVSSPVLMPLERLSQEVQESGGASSAAHKEIDMNAGVIPVQESPPGLW